MSINQPHQLSPRNLYKVGNPYRFICFFFLVFFLSNGGIIAQNHKAYIQKIGIEEGLSSYKIDDLFQDSRGLIWLATSYGLNCYDGTRVKYYTQEKDGLCHNHVQRIAEDDLGNIWLWGGDFGGTRHYCIFDPITEQFYTIEEYIGRPCPFDPTNVFLQPYFNGTLLFPEVKGEEILCYELKNKQFRVAFRWKNILTVPYIRSPFFKLNDNEYLASRGFEQDKHRIIYIDSIGQIIKEFFFDEGLKVWRHNIGKQDITFITTNFPHSDPLKCQLYHAKEGLIDSISVLSNEWAYYYFNKIYVLGNNYLKIFSKEGALLETINLDLEIINPLYLFVDNQNNVHFVEGQYYYIISLQKQFFKVELDNYELPCKTRGILKTAKGELVATGIGFFLTKRLKADSWKDPNDKHPMSGMGMLEDGETVWLANEHSNLLEYNTATQEFKSYVLPIDNTHKIVWIPYKALDGTIWVGTSRGLYYLDKVTKQLKGFDYGTKFPELQNSVIYAFHTNNKGTWLSTSSGLYLVDLLQQKVLEHYNKKQAAPNYIPAEHLAHLHEDKDGFFWLASKGNGLIKWHPTTKEYEKLSRANVGFSSDELYAVYEDDNNNLWLPSERGLMRYNKNTKLVTTYLQEDGLPHNEFNTIAHYQDNTGQLYFGTQNGFIQFDPKDINETTFKAPFVITSCVKKDRQTDTLTILTSSLLATNNIEVNPTDKSVELRFALLDYKKIKGNQYSYKIEGYNKTWIYQTVSFVEISGLPYGTYTLYLRAKSSGNSEWIDYAHPIVIQVLKPFYLEWWFIIISILALGFGVFVLIRVRTQNLLKQQRALEKLVAERTEKIEEDKKVIEEQANELKALDKVKTRFFANISHELRTPLTLILGPLSYILDHPEELEKEAVRQQLLTMQRNGKSLMQLIEEILDLTKLEANKLELEEDVTPVKSFFENVFYVFENQFQNLDLDYELFFDVTDDLYVLLDRKKMEKILNNFLGNASKFTDKKGKISLSVIEKATTIHIQVFDTGKGIHPSDLPHIFERFYQSKQAEQKLYGGTGIGLALVKEFAQLMGANVYAESVLGEGSQFYFELPKKIATPNQPFSTSLIPEQEEELINSIGTDFTILIVEDNKDMQAFVYQLLQKRYQKVLVAQNGEEGLALLQQYGTAIHLILSDIMMPKIDGLTMLKEIKSSPIWNQIPVIMLTALAAERDKLSALTIGVDDYLTKPFSVSELLIRIQNLLYNYHQRLTWQESIVEESEQDAIIEEEEPENSEIDKEWVKQVEILVKNSIKTGLFDVDGLAAAVYLGKRQLTRRIKSNTGLTPAKFIREVQLQLARTELEDGNFISITEVAYNSGFEHPSTFFSLFKKRFGKAPSEYLKTI